MNRLAPHAGFPAPALALVLVLAATPATAADASWQVRVFGARVEPGDGYGFSDGANSITVEPEGTWGLGAGVEYRFSRRFGLGLTALVSDVEVATAARVAEFGAAASDRGDLGVQIYGLGLDVHLSPGRALDLVLTPAVALVDYDDLTVDLGDLGIAGDFAFDDETTASLGLRADLARGSWLLTGGIAYVDTSAEAVDAEVDGQKIVLEIDPLVVSFGIGYRF